MIKSASSNLPGWLAISSPVILKWRYRARQTVNYSQRAARPVGAARRTRFVFFLRSGPSNRRDDPIDNVVYSVPGPISKVDKDSFLLGITDSLFECYHTQFPALLDSSDMFWMMFFFCSPFHDTNQVTVMPSQRKRGCCQRSWYQSAGTCLRSAGELWATWSV